MAALVVGSSLSILSFMILTRQRTSSSELLFFDVSSWSVAVVFFHQRRFLLIFARFLVFKERSTDGHVLTLRSPCASA